MEGGLESGARAKWGEAQESAHEIIEGKPGGFSPADPRGEARFENEFENESVRTLNYHLMDAPANSV